MTNPLSKYYRQPKIYLSLPSKGEYYPPGCINGDPTNLPVYGMTAMDEIMFKTPDALFSGESMVSIIKSCIPAILDPWKIPSIDIDSILIAIRIATYGQLMPSTFKCSHCKEDNKFDLDLSSTLDYFNSLEYDNKIFTGPLVVNLKPLNYQEQTQQSIKAYQIRKTLNNIQASSSTPEGEEERLKEINKCLKDIAELEVNGFKKQIHSVEAEDETVENQNEINDWLQHSDKEFFDDIKDHLTKKSQIWKIQKQKCNCGECGKENEVTIGMDNSSFFVKR